MTIIPESEAKWERRDVDTGALYLVVVLLGIGGVLAFLLAAGCLQFFEHRCQESLPAHAFSGGRPPFPAPSLQVSPPRELEAFREEEDRELNTAGWVDRPRGLVRIPIDRAIGLVLERGLPRTTQRVTPLQLQQQRAEERGGRGAH